MKYFLFPGLLCYAILLILSIHYYEARTVFTDIAFHLYHLAKTGDLAIQNQRFVAAATQAFPLAAIHLKAPLSNVAVLYSAAFTIIPALLFLVGIRISNSSAISILLFSLLIPAHTFFWIQSELPQGFYVMLLLIGLMALPTAHKRTLFAALLLPVCVLAHPLLIFPFAFALGFLVLGGSISIQKGGLYFLAWASIWAVKKVFFSAAYETSALSGLKNFATLFPKYWQAQSFIQFERAAQSTLLPFILIIFAIFIYYVRNKSFKLLGFSCSFLIGYTLLILISHPYDAPDHYLENLLLPLSIIAIMPLAFDILPKTNPRQVAVGILLLLIAHIATINFTAPYYTQRVSYLTELTKKYPAKSVIPMQKVDKGVLEQCWGTPYETWLLSMIQFEKSASILVTEEPANYHQSVAFNKHFIGTWEIDPYEELPSPYFNFSDTSAYQIIQ